MTHSSFRRHRYAGPVRYLIPLLLMCTAALSAVTVHADTNAQVAAALTSNDVYVSNAMPPSAHVAPGDAARLQGQTHAAVNSGVPEKIALVSHFPNNYRNAYAAADGLRKYLDFSGALVLVSPTGIGVASNTLTLGEIQSIEQKARPLCLASYANCAVVAARLAVTQTKSDTSAANKSAAVFWLVLLAILAVIIGAVVFFVRGRQRRTAGNLNELRAAASRTLSLADSAVEEIEAAGAAMPDAIRSDYDRALALRAGAKVGLERATNPAGLTQANQDAAQAVLALQGVMKALGLKSALSNPLEAPTGHRCFYCGRTDRPPYVARTIDDNRGNTMQIEVCTVDLARLEQGRTPQIQTVQYNGAMVPWWAVPNSPYYYSYGGPTWQYWLPFMIGMDVGGWYGGGWEGGYGYGDFDGGASYGDAGVAAPDSGTIDPSTDMGAGDFGGWGGGTDPSGGWGGDSGDSGGWGGDSGGGDWGGGDSGGGDSGGW